MPTPSAIYPKIAFISSNHVPEIIEAIRYHLTEEDIFPSFLHTGFTEISGRAIDQLTRHTQESDFAIFWFNEEDIERLKPGSQTDFLDFRDSMLLKLGVFLGTLAKERIFFLKPSNIPIPLIPELSGITEGILNPNRSDVQAAVSVFCNKMVGKMKTLDLRDKRPFAEEPEEMDVLINHFSLKVLNFEGDGIIRRTLTIRANENNVRGRIHRIFSDTYGSTFEELNLKVWNERGEPMAFECIYDAPSKKEFSVLYRNPLSKDEQLTYTYQFFWKKMFPKESSDFTLKSTAPKVLFHLSLPENWDLMHIHAVKIRLDGALGKKSKVFLRKIKEEKEQEGFIKRSYELQDLSVNHPETYIKWLWQEREVS